MPTLDSISHIHCDARGKAWIDNTNVKVIEVVLDHLAYGWSPEEMHEQHPGLSLGQIHAALGYYYDHKAEMDAQIENGKQYVLGLMAAQASDPNFPVRKRLREKMT